MPRVISHNAKPLFNLCVEFVASNLNYWRNPLETELNSVHVLQHNNPFDKLPSVLLEEVIRMVRKILYAGFSLSDEGKLRKELFELLVTPHLRTLDLSMCESNVAPCLLNLASLRCPDMKSVTLACPISNCVDVMVHLCALKFEKLQVLNISDTNAGDSCLQILGMYCKDLRELNLQGCEKITDAGIEGLCVSVDHLGKEDKKLGQCKSIETLFIGKTKITKKGIQTALKNLPLLKVLKGCPGSYNHKISLQLLAEMHQPDSNNEYSLNSLYLNNWNLINDYGPEDPPLPYISGSLGLVASICPSVRSVEIKLIKGLTDWDLFGLLSLENINELEISADFSVDNDMSVTFEGGVVRILKGFGSSLKVLGLSCLNDVDIRAIINLCPKLKSLTLDTNESYTTVGTKENIEPFQSKRIKTEPLVLNNLETLRIFSSNRSDDAEEEQIISSEDLLSLFSSSSLININITACDNLTDYVFERAAEIHQFLNLEQLSISLCHTLTRKGIDVVMNKKTPLSAIEITYCHKVQDEDIALLLSNARSEKWQLSFIHDENELDMD